MEGKPKRRKTGGRVKHVPPLRKTHLTLTEEQLAALRKWGRGDASAGLRWLIEQAKKLVRKAEEQDPPHSNG